jgi:hypothetical protein
MIENTLINKSQNKRSKFIKKYVYTLQYTKIDNDDNSCLYIWKYIYIYYHISTSKRVVYPYQISTNYSNSTRYNSIIIFKK